MQSYSALNFQLVLLSGKNPSQEGIVYYKKAYAFWYTQWLNTFNNLNIDNEFYSDDFLRQEEVACLFYEDKPVGIFLFSWMNLDLDSHRKCSFFKYYSNEVLEELVFEGITNVMTMGYLLVDSKWRKKALSFSIADVFLSIAVSSFKSKSGDGILCFTRNDRGVNDIVYRHGGQTLEKDIMVNDIPSDLIVIKENKAKLTSDMSARNLAIYLWNKRLDFTEYMGAVESPTESRRIFNTP